MCVEDKSQYSLANELKSVINVLNHSVEHLRSEGDDTWMALSDIIEELEGIYEYLPEEDEPE